MEQRRAGAQHALQAHVERLGGRFHLAADVEVDLTAIVNCETTMEEFIPSP